MAGRPEPEGSDSYNVEKPGELVNGPISARDGTEASDLASTQDEGASQSNENEVDVYISDNEDSPIFIAPVGGASAAGNQQKSESVVVRDNKSAQMIVAAGSRTTVVTGNVGAQMIIGNQGASGTSGGQLQGRRITIKGNKNSQVFMG